MDSQDQLPRRIETMTDVAAVLESPAASFLEMMDCVRVSEEAGDWKVRHHCAERAFEMVDPEARNAVESLSSAAKVVIANYFKAASTLEELRPSLSAATNWLGDRRSRLDQAGGGRFVDDQTNLLAELQVLMSTATPEAKVRLCSKLRKLERSDLGIEAVRQVANDQPPNVRALTTLGAAYCDMGEYAKAERALKAALEVEPRSVQPLVALSRAYQNSGQEYRAFDVAKVAFVQQVDEYTAHRLMAAAAAVKDEDAFNQALDEVKMRAQELDESDVSVYVLLVAAEVCLDKGDLGEVRKIVETIKTAGEALSGRSVQRFSELKKALHDANTPKLFDDDDGR